MTKLPKLIILTFLSLVALLAIAPKTHAQSGNMIVAPARQVLTVDPGETKTISIKFINQGTSPIGGAVGVADFVVLDKSGTPHFLDNENGLSSLYSAASWVTLPSSDAVITAGGQVLLQARIAVPQDAKAGGRYFGIYFEPGTTVPSEIGAEYEAGQAITPRLAGLVYLRVSGPIEENAQVIRFVTPNFSEYGPVAISTDIINRGNYHIRPTGKIDLYDFLGRKVATSDLEEQNIFPDATRTYTNELGRQIMLGKFSAKLTASYGESGQVLSSTTSFWVFPWRIALIIILTLIIIALVIVITLKSLKGKQKRLEDKLQTEIEELEALKNKLKDNTPPAK
jgi:hypothetical protein